ncbi:hypothetical protein K3495_g6179 [Podosphaera aphanis]|nr:hypothetical protein K3495_g6179 [Podosphaera aphanis]
MSLGNSALKILSANVGRSSVAHELALQFAFQIRADLLLVQEPCVAKDLTRKITWKHPSFECFTPADDWSIRPRVMSYSRKNLGLNFTQLRPKLQQQHVNGNSPFLSVETLNCPKTLVINASNAPPELLIRESDFRPFFL